MASEMSDETCFTGAARPESAQRCADVEAWRVKHAPIDHGLDKYCVPVAIVAAFLAVILLWSVLATLKESEAARVLSESEVRLRQQLAYDEDLASASVEPDSPNAELRRRGGV